MQGWIQFKPTHDLFVDKSIAPQYIKKWTNFIADSSIIHSAMKDKRILGIVPARGNSKRLPGKNLAMLGGHPLLSYAIHPAIQSKVFDRVIVSSDCSEILSVAKKYNAETPFVRPPELAKDDVGDLPVIKHALTWLEENESYKPDFVLLLRCTTPFKIKEDFHNILDIWQNTNSDSVRSVTEVTGVDHPFWMYKSGDNNLLQPAIDGISVEHYYQRQLLPRVYRLNGVLDGMTPACVLADKLYGNTIAKLEISEERALDIDTHYDFELAKFTIEKYGLYLNR